jgi:hypothetical protein
MHKLPPRRGLLAGAPIAAAAALAGDTITTALAMAPPKAAGLDWPAIVRRAAQVTDRLQKYYGPDWTSGDQEAAAGVLMYCRDREAGLPDDETAWKATLKFFWDYGQSLDYVIYGDPVSMIAKSAARSPRGRPAWEAETDPIFGMIEAHRAAVAAVNAADDVNCKMCPSDPNSAAASQASSAASEDEMDALRELLGCGPTTLEGGPPRCLTTSGSRSSFAPVATPPRCSPARTRGTTKRKMRCVNSRTCSPPRFAT